MITYSRFDALAFPIIQGISWHTAEKLVASETNTMVSKAPNSVAPQYLVPNITKSS